MFNSSSFLLSLAFNKFPFKNNHTIRSVARNIRPSPSSVLNMSTSSSNRPNENIKKKVIECEEYFKSRGAPAPDSPATATLVKMDGLLCEVTSPSKKGTIYTDMPEAIGGTRKQTEFNSPGWHLRAALAACDVSMIQIRAARLDLELNSVQVIVDASSDGRGMLGTNVHDHDGLGVSAASTEMNITYKIGIEGTNTTKEQVDALINWVEKHSPVATDVKEGIRNRMKGKIELV